MNKYYENLNKYTAAHTGNVAETLLVRTYEILTNPQQAGKGQVEAIELLRPVLEPNDREVAEREAVLLKKENAKLRAEIAELKQRLSDH